MNYSKMSNFEINIAVFEELHGGSPDCKEGGDGAMVIISYEGDVIGGNAVEVEVERGSFNPCNNPADAWPIIEENSISIIKYDNTQWRARHRSCAPGTVDINPLRAAMIVFLQTRE